MRPLLTAEEMRTLDAHTIQVVGVPGPVLMETAGRGVFFHLWRQFEERASAGPTAVVCGKGNNGGDGFVVARCLAGLGCDATALLLGNRDDVKGDAALQLAAYLAAGGALVEVGQGNRTAAERALAEAGLIVDAVLGTGLSEDVRGLPAEAIGWINASSAPVVAVDIPSGVSSDTGRVCGAAVRPALTVTFGLAKRGHYLYPGAALTGQLEVVDIGIPRSAIDTVSPGLLLLEPGDFEGLLTRAPDAHKGDFGHVFVFGGSAGKEGAAGLAGWAALRAGAGLCTVAWPSGVHPAGAARLPLELMTEPLPEPGSCQLEWSEAIWDAAERAQRRADALVIGPGMGAGEGTRGFLSRLLASNGPPMVVDADALNALAEWPELWRPGLRGAVLTPHPGEAARLLGVATGQVQEDRVAALRQLAERFEAQVILKGAHTLVAGPGTPVYLVPRGNPGMATAGSGDVLSGVVGALLARGLSPSDAARLGAYVHALSGDLAAEGAGQEGLTASDLLTSLPKAMRALAAGDHR